MAVTQDNRIAVAVDILDDHEDPEYMDFLSAKGYVLALNLACRTAIGGQAVAAPVCSSWIWLCRASTKRTLMQPHREPCLPIRQAGEFDGEPAHLAAHDFSEQRHDRYFLQSNKINICISIFLSFTTKSKHIWGLILMPLLA